MKILKLTLILIALLLYHPTASIAQKDVIQEHQIKAVFLFNFIQFVEWPPQSFDSAEAPVVIGILGKDPFGSYLDEVLAGEAINGRSVKVKRFNTLNEVENCHILFMHSFKLEDYPKIFDKIKGKNILTISDDKDFMKAGGIIRFVNVDKKVQFQINPEAARRANLSISSKLLSLAEIVAVNETH